MEAPIPFGVVGEMLDLFNFKKMVGHFIAVNEKLKCDLFEP